MRDLTDLMPNELSERADELRRCVVAGFESVGVDFLAEVVPECSFEALRALATISCWSQ